jgi:D-alanyl-D-alanine carboxypeptidase (penicillin-binding protein 5/6)
MKRIASFALAVVLFFGVAFSGIGGGYRAEASQTRYYIRQAGNSPSDMNVAAAGAVLIEQGSGKVLYEKGAEEKLYPASTTKILTALLAIENGDINEIVTLGPEVAMIDKDGSRAGLKPGEKIKLGDLLMGLMLPSGNDAANAIAVHIGRKIAGDQSLDVKKAIQVFVDKMNERALEIGAKGSHFANPHGFHDINHYTTAYDLALITREAMKHDFFRNVVSTGKYSGVYTDGSKVIEVWGNTNKLINKDNRYYFQYATGIKTGHTTSAGYCLVSSASENGMDVIAVVLNTTPEGQWKDSTSLLEYGLNNFTHHTLVKNGELLRTVGVENKLPWDKSELDIISGGESSGIFDKNEISSIKGELLWDKNLIKPSAENENIVRINSSIEKGEKIGKIVYSLNGKVVGESDIQAGRSVSKNFWVFDIISTKLLKDKKSTVITAAVVIASGYLILVMRVKRKRTGNQRKRKNLIR